jgi:Flp pilus assembly protein TadD
MQKLRKTIGLVACGLLIFAGCSSGPTKSGWFSWMPTVKVPALKNPFAKDNLEQKAVALSDETERPHKAVGAPTPVAPKKQPLGEAVAVQSTPVPAPHKPEAKRAPAITAWPLKQPQPTAQYDQDLAQGIELARNGQNAAAREVFQRLLAEEPSRPEAYQRLGQLAAGEGRHQEAEGLYGQALALDARNAEVLNDLGYSLYCQGKLAQAENVTLKAVALQPSNPQLRTNLGVIYGHQGRGREALEQFRLAGSEADACANLAEILASRNDRAGAKDYLKQALAAQPDHSRAREALAALEARSESPLRTANVKEKTVTR